MGILPGHVRLMSLLRPGELVARTAEGDRRFAVAGGFVDISSTGVSVFVDACEGSNDIDVERARRALANAERAALEHKGADEAESQERGQAIERARARIAVAERATR
jgi:F-type H+-transporting ATPase subunit epsilon